MEYEKRGEAKNGAWSASLMCKAWIRSFLALCLQYSFEKKERRCVRGARAGRDAVRCASLREEFICNRKRPICTAGHQSKTRSLSWILSVAKRWIAKHRKLVGSIWFSVGVCVLVVRFLWVSVVRRCFRLPWYGIHLCIVLTLFSPLSESVFGTTYTEILAFPHIIIVSHSFLAGHTSCANLSVKCKAENVWKKMTQRLIVEMWEQTLSD